MAMTDEQITALVNDSSAALKTELTKAADTSINGALTRFQKEVLPNALKEAGKETNEQLATLLTNLTALQEAAGSKGNDDKGGKGKGGDVSPEIKSQLTDLQKANDRLAAEIKGEKDLRTAAEKNAKTKDKEAQVRTALSAFEFASPDAAEDAFILVSGKADFNDEGQLLADGLPFADFAKAYIPEKKSHLLKPVGRAGAGANSGTNKTGGAKPVAFEDIKPGMKPEDMQTAASQILQAMKGTT